MIAERSWLRETAGRRPAGFRPTRSSVISALISIVLVTVSAIMSPETIHWFLLPLVGCGTLIGIDAVDVVRGRASIFDPAGLLGVVGYHFFFLAPLLHVHLDHWMVHPDPPADWREWLGWMAVINAVGLIVYRTTRAFMSARRPRAAAPSWTLAGPRFRMWLFIALAATALLQAWVYQRFGGVLGFVEAFTGQEPGADAFKGLGWMYMLSESFPIIALIGLVVMIRRRDSIPSWKTILLLLAFFFVAKLLFGGLRGSRSNTIWGLFWAVGIVHLRLRAVPRSAAAVGALFLVAFMYVYGFYKASGSQAVVVLRSAEERTLVSERSGRTWSAALLGDLARSDVQAMLLHRLLRPGGDVELAMGRTYVGAAALLVPSGIWAGRPDTKVREGTEAQYGRGSYGGPGTGSSRVYGLAGEALLNFGVVGAILSFALLGWAVAQAQRITARWANDSRIFMAPFVANACLVLLVSDSDNLLVFGLKGFLPFLLLALSSSRRRAAAPPLRRSPRPAVG